MKTQYRLMLAGMIAIMLTVSGCVTNGTNNAAFNNVTIPESTNHSPNHPSSLTPASAGSAPSEISGVPGALFSAQSWLFQGAKTHKIDGPMLVEGFSSSGFTIGGVHWTWPASDTNPDRYIVVPTTIQSKPYLVWCHLASEKALRKLEDGGAGYESNQLQPTGPSQMWMVPWRTNGGSLQNGAKLITDDIPPVWSRSGQIVFTNTKVWSPASIAGSAWSGWFQWGRGTHPYSVPPAKWVLEPTIAVPNSLYPAYNGVVLSIRTRLLQANQGLATNLYYINLVDHTIEGLASLTDGGGLFSSLRVVSGMVFTGFATDLPVNSNVDSAAFVYNEVTRYRTPVESLAVMSQNNGFDRWMIRGGTIYDANNKLVTNLSLSASVLNEPSAETFGVYHQ